MIMATFAWCATPVTLQVGDALDTDRMLYNKTALLRWEIYHPQGAAGQ